MYVIQTKLTLRLDEGVIVRAKTWARKRCVSLSEAMATLFDQLQGAPEKALSPWTQKLVGIGGRGKRRSLSDGAIRRAHLDHLEEKHQ